MRKSHFDGCDHHGPAITAGVMANDKPKQRSLQPNEIYLVNVAQSPRNASFPIALGLLPHFLHLRTLVSRLGRQVPSLAFRALIGPAMT